MIFCVIQTIGWGFVLGVFSTAAVNFIIKTANRRQK